MSSLEDEIAQGEDAGGRVHRALQRFRRWTAHHPLLRLVHKTVVTIVGVVLVLLGVAMLVLPGPGWLAIFLGLGVLGTEFHWARRLNQRAKRLVMRGWRWWLARTAESRHRRALAGPAGLVLGPRHLRAPDA